MSESEIAALPLARVIDDDQTIHLWAKGHLAVSGFNVIFADEGHEGIDAFKRHSPDIVLIDAEMPEMDGFITCSGTRNVPGGSNTPLLMVTESEDAAIVNAILALATALNLYVIAEGIETDLQKQFLQNTTCQAIQGYLFSKPMPMTEFQEYWQSISQQA